MTFDGVGVVPGALLPVTGVQNQPDLHLASSSNGPFVVLMIDPDVRFNNSNIEILHWLQQDLILTHGGTMKLSSFSLTTTSTSLAPYVPPVPPAELPPHPHRYIQLLFRQPTNFSIPATFKDVIMTRIGFNLIGFVQDAKLGDVIAANYFRVTNTSLVLETSGVQSKRADAAVAAYVVGISIIALSILAI